MGLRACGRRDTNVQEGDDPEEPLFREESSGTCKIRRPWLSPKSPFNAIIIPWIRWRGRRVGPLYPLSRDRIQELDGGFFEKFGTLLKEQHSQQEDGDGLASVREDEQPRSVELQLDIPEETGEGSPAMALQDSDSEPDDADKREFITDAMGWNIEELYSEILYEILHIVGCDAAAEEERAPLFCYLQEAFKLDYEKHNQLLEMARAKEAPNILLNVEVIEARDLRPKDANGLSDPFCTLFLTSSVAHRYNTSVKQETLNPVWEEHFSLPVENPAEDVLYVEVWDFDPAETVREKMMKIGEVKGVRGLRKLMKEIAVTASTGKHDNELVGCAALPLKNIPASGQTLWCTLEKKGKAKKQGDVKIQLSFSSEKNSQVASQEHRHLLRLMLLHELENSKVEPFQWNGKFSQSAETILTQHLVQCGLSTAVVTLAQWVEFSSVHVDHPLSFITFSLLLQKLIKPLQNGLITDDEEKLFWEAAKKILPSCYNGIRKIRKLTHSDKSTLQQLSAILSILSQLATLQPPEGTNLFPPSIYGWLAVSENEPNCDIRATLDAAVTQGAEDWFFHILENNNSNDPSEEAQLNHLIRIIQLLRTDLQKAIEFHDRLFQQYFRFSYAKTLYKLYESKVAELVEPVVTEVCKSLKPLKFNDRATDGICDNDPLLMGTTLFELYLIVQRFAVLGTGLCPVDSDVFNIHNFHLWFHAGVAQWLDIALYKALQRIKKAVEIDNLVPVDGSVKYSSSAVDTLAIFYQIKIFWKQLAWPDVEGSYTFVAKIIDDICRCSVFYADQMSGKVEGMGESQNVYEKKFEVTNEWCLAINNIDYVQQSIQPFVGELGMEEIVTSLANFRSQTAADHCQRTLQLVIDNAVDTVGNKILELLEKVAEKMAPAINRFLLEGAELLKQENNCVDRLMKYLDDNLLTLHSHLNTDNFSRILSIIWENLSHTMYELVESNLERRRPPTFFLNLHETLKILVGFFKQGEEKNETNSPAILKQIEHLLLLHGMETWELIHQYNLERREEQIALELPNLGLLTVRIQFVEDLLRIEILNARNLHAMDANGSCDPYVKVHLLPEEKFRTVTKPRTKTHKKTMFPLFDENFTLHLTPEQRHLKNGLIMFTVKDQDFLGMNEFLGEAFVSFSDVPKTDMTTGLEELEQVHLKLSRPTKQDSEAYRALENRHDKLSRDFLKKEKAKYSSS
ncbi:protein unc-13 homolog 4B isoform X2 [Zootermopsis nevadensis]|uniref:protein unc-13 homolog 4B isoform X2 n=1 Tax=Zootermopsis nevadensis TaxID=136037 RepID=UPI000B8E973F|nr:protein unc-13 homolog 4B isoform X2 [Zootermopsis nevadensis]